MKLKILLLILVVSAIAAALSSCSEQPYTSGNTSDISIDKTNNFEYIVIYGHNASDSVVHQASLLCKTLKDSYGIEIYTKSDWEYRPNDSLETQNQNKRIEILLGQTNRQQSEEVYNSFTAPNEYVIKVDNGALVIAATSDNLLISAIEYFKTSILSEQSGSASIPVNTEIRNDDFSFFDIAKNGLSGCAVVIPGDSSTRIQSLAQSIASKINSLCGTEIKVLSEDSVEDTRGCILIGNVNDPDCTDINKSLEPSQSVVKYINSKIIIAGYNEASLINGIFSFMGNVVMKHDKCPDGSAYLYFPTHLMLEDNWSHVVPNIPGSVLESFTQDSNFLFNLSYNDIDKAEFANYIELLKSLNFIVTNNKNPQTDIYLVSATYNHVDASASINGMVELVYNKAEKTLNMTMTYTLVNL